jgi:hypothetical protein
MCRVASSAIAVSSQHIHWIDINDPLNFRRRFQCSEATQRTAIAIVNKCLIMVEYGRKDIDDTGKPLKGADVKFPFHWQHRSRTPQICSYPVWVKTDDNGAWSCDLIPPAMLPTELSFWLRISILCPNIALNPMISMTSENRQPLD